MGLNLRQPRRDAAGRNARTTLGLPQGLLAVLVAYLSLAPVLPDLHLGLAPHAHRYNAFVGYFEDIVVQGGRADQRPAPVSPRERHLSAPRGHVLFAACQQSNQGLLLGLPRPTSSVVAEPPPGSEPAPRPMVRLVSSTSLLSLAPKHSPPVTSA